MLGINQLESRNNGVCGLSLMALDPPTFMQPIKIMKYR